MPAGRRETSAQAQRAGGHGTGVAADPVLPGAALAKLARRHPDVARALAALAAGGKITGNHSGRISARVDPGLFAAAATRFGLSEHQVSEVVNASLAVAAAPDTFKQWLRTDHDRLPDDFELAI